MNQKPNAAAWVAIVWMFTPIILCIVLALVMYYSGYSWDEFFMILLRG